MTPAREANLKKMQEKRRQKILEKRNRIINSKAEPKKEEIFTSQNCETKYNNLELEEKNDNR